MQKEFFYNNAIAELGFSGYYAGKLYDLTDDEIVQVEAKADEIFTAEMQVAKNREQLRQNKEEALKFILAGKPVPESLKNKIESIEKVYDFEFDFTKDDKEKHERTDLIKKGNVALNEEGAVFAGDGYYSFSKKPIVKNKSFEIKATVKISEVQDNNYVLGDSGTATDKAIHFGFRNSNTFTVAFYADDMNATVEQIAGKTYDIEFIFDADIKKGKLTINGEVFEHTYKAKYQDNISYIGRGANASQKFKGILKDLKILIK